MKKLITSFQQGQIIVLFAVVLIALLGFTALAVDGSMIYSDRRAAQNAADSAALAGGGMAAQSMENGLVNTGNFTCSYTPVLTAENTAVTTAINRAATNNYTIDNNIADQNGVQVICNAAGGDPYLDVKVMITAPTSTSFAQLFYSSPIKNTVTSIVRVRPRKNFANGNAIYSTGTSCTSCSCTTDGISITGNATANSDTGGIFSNSQICTSGSPHWNVANGGVSYVSTFTAPGDPSGLHPYPPTHASSTLPIPVVPPPDCSGLPVRGTINSNSTDQTINPGQYTQINVSGADHTLHLTPGLYCINDTNATPTGITITNGTTLEGMGGITIYFIRGGWNNVNGSGVNIQAPTGDALPAIRGMLLFAATTNTGAFTIANGTSGGGSNDYNGTIFIPNGSFITTGNMQSDALGAQVVAKRIVIANSAGLYLSFDSSYIYQTPATLNLQQ